MLYTIEQYKKTIINSLFNKMWISVTTEWGNDFAKQQAEYLKEWGEYLTEAGDELNARVWDKLKTITNPNISSALHCSNFDDLTANQLSALINWWDNISWSDLDKWLRSAIWSKLWSYVTTFTPKIWIEAETWSLIIEEDLAPEFKVIKIIPESNWGISINYVNVEPVEPIVNNSSVENITVVNNNLVENSAVVDLLGEDKNPFETTYLMRKYGLNEKYAREIQRLSNYHKVEITGENLKPTIKISGILIMVNWNEKHNPFFN